MLVEVATLLPTLWNIGILLIKRPPGPNNMMASLFLKSFGEPPLTLKIKYF
jgi:hypothetical protein